jgi:hypothetical protein
MFIGLLHAVLKHQETKRRSLGIVEVRALRDGGTRIDKHIHRA